MRSLLVVVQLKMGVAGQKRRTPARISLSKKKHFFQSDGTKPIDVLPSNVNRRRPMEKFLRKDLHQLFERRIDVVTDQRLSSSRENRPIPCTTAKIAIERFFDVARRRSFFAADDQSSKKRHEHSRSAESTLRSEVLHELMLNGMKRRRRSRRRRVQEWKSFDGHQMKSIDGTERKKTCSHCSTVEFILPPTREKHCTRTTSTFATTQFRTTQMQFYSHISSINKEEEEDRSYCFSDRREVSIRVEHFVR